MESGSRVGNIKKKFEGLNESSVNSNAQFRHILKKPVLSSDVRSGVKSGTLIDNITQENQQNNPSGSKGNIRRSHAFRSDKHIRPFSSQSTVNSEDNLSFVVKRNSDQQNKQDNVQENEKSSELQTAFNLVKNKYKEGQDSRLAGNLNKSSCEQSKIISKNFNLNTQISNFSKDVCYSCLLYTSRCV